LPTFSLTSPAWRSEPPGIVPLVRLAIIHTAEVGGPESNSAHQFSQVTEVGSGLRQSGTRINRSTTRARGGGT
jgi:hypothetical protein